MFPRLAALAVTASLVLSGGCRDPDETPANSGASSADPSDRSHATPPPAPVTRVELGPLAIRDISTPTDPSAHSALRVEIGDRELTLTDGSVSASTTWTGEGRVIAVPLTTDRTEQGLVVVQRGFMGFGIYRLLTHASSSDHVIAHVPGGPRLARPLGGDEPMVQTLWHSASAYSQLTRSTPSNSRWADIDRDGRHELVFFSASGSYSMLRYREPMYERQSWMPGLPREPFPALGEGGPLHGAVRASLSGGRVRLAAVSDLASTPLNPVVREDLAPLQERGFGHGPVFVGPELLVLVLHTGAASSTVAHVFVLSAEDAPEILAHHELGPASDAPIHPACPEAFGHRSAVRSTDWTSPGSVRAVVATWRASSHLLLGQAFQWNDGRLTPATSAVPLDSCGGTRADIVVTPTGTSTPPRLEVRAIEGDLVRLW